MAAFVITGSTFTTAGAPTRGAFAGAAVSPRQLGALRPSAVAPPRMVAYSLDKYNKLSGGDAAPPAVAGPQGMSGGYRAYLDSVKASKGESYRTPRRTAAGGPSPAYSTSALLAGGSPFFYLQGAATAAKFGKGGDATADVVPGGRTGAAADKYMAQCVRSQYKATAVSTGVYTPACTEGTVKGAADASRVAALSAAFRAGQRSSAQKYGDYYEARRQATLGTHGCSYEEALVSSYPRVAAAMVMGQAEATRSCVRYGMPSSTAETYMAASVDRQMKARAVATGVYSPACTDGGVSGEAETKRVAALATRFRAGHLPATARAQAAYDAAAYARLHFGHGCGYEEAAFERYPAVAAAMRPSTARY